MTYFYQLLAAGASPEEAARSYAMNEALRIENFQRYSTGDYYEREQYEREAMADSWPSTDDYQGSPHAA